jgi:archaellum component FlaF (FlaF/FlaG flagellin family)
MALKCFKRDLFMKFINSKKGISTAISTLLMINIALILGIIVYLSAQNTLGSFISSNSLYFQLSEERLKEKIVIVNARFYDTNDPNKFRFNITVLNLGYRHAWISAIYINGTDVLPEIALNSKGIVWNSTGKIQSQIDGKYLIVVGDSLTFAFRPNAEMIKDMKYDRIVSITIATSNGITAKEHLHITNYA